MTDKSGNRHIRMTAVFTILLLILCMFTGILPELRAQAAGTVVIKTQAAADSIKNGIRGIDVSKHNGTINWKRVATDNVKFAMIRSNYGTDIDPNFVTNAKAAYENGLHVGAYHYARFKDSASVKKEAAAFMKQLKKVTLTYPAVLDIENHQNLSRAKLTNLCIEFLDILEENGYRVMLYSYQNFFTGHLDLKKLKNYDIWAAHYTEKPSGIDHVMWQHTSYGTVKGINGRVDINIAYKSLAGRKTATAATAIATGSSSTARQPTTYETIISFLNEHYAANLDVKNNLTMDEINHVIYSAFQTELNRQMGENIIVNGIIDEYAVEALSSIPFTLDQTQGRITTLIQSKLYFKKHASAVNGVYDASMHGSLKSLQAAFGLEETGQLDYDTWLLILNMQ